MNGTLSAVSAKGLTLNRAEATDLKIELYTNGKVTTTITSPKADLYVADRKMRTKNTVQIERADLEATGQTCDFDLISKKYLLRQNVKVILKNFDISPVSSGSGASKTHAKAAGPVGAGSAEPEPVPDDSPAPVADTHHARNGDSLLDMPGGYANTDVAPIPPPIPVTP